MLSHPLGETHTHPLLRFARVSGETVDLNELKQRISDPSTRVPMGGGGELGGAPTGALASREAEEAARTFWRRTCTIWYLFLRAAILSLQHFFWL